MSILDWNWTIVDWTLVLVTIGLAVYYCGTKTFNRFINVPHLKPLPFVGNMSKMVFGGQSFPCVMQDVYNGLKGHPYGGFYMFKEPVTLVMDPELIKTITMKDFDYFTDHKNVVTKEMDPLWHRTLFGLTGQEWKDMRYTLSPAFTSSKMKNMFMLVSDCCQQLVDFLEGCQHKGNKGCNIRAKNDLLVLEMKDLFTRYANDVIATTAFGIGVDSLKEQDNQFYRMGQEGVKIAVWKLITFWTIPARIVEWMGLKLIPEEVTTFFTNLITETIKTREEKGIVRPDILHLLMQAKKGMLETEDSTEKNKPSKRKLTDEDILAQTRLFFLVGFDTTSTLLSFAMYLLAHHSDVQSKLQEEIDKTLEDNDGKFHYDVIHNMEYLDMVTSETLRIYPPTSAIERVCNRRYTLQADPPFEFRPGDVIHVPIFGAHRDPRNFPHPERFDPERFSKERKHEIKPMTYLPFGIGPRGCIGYRFALMESKLALAYILSKFDVKTVEKTPKTVKLLQAGFVMTIDGGFWLGLQSRKS